MESLRWVDSTYIQKHKSENPQTLRAMYHGNLRMYSTKGESKDVKSLAKSFKAFVTRYGKRTALSLGVYALSLLPVVGGFVLPLASFYTFNKAVGPVPAIVVFGSGLVVPKRALIMFLQSYFASRSLMRELVCTIPPFPSKLCLHINPALTKFYYPQLEPYFSRIKFTKEQRRRWFLEREGVLFGFAVGFYIMLRIPLLGVLLYGIAEASTAYLITKITDPPPAPAYSEGFAESQVTWTNKHSFLKLPLDSLDLHNIQAADEPKVRQEPEEVAGKKFS